MTNSKRITIVDKPEYKLVLEYNEEYIALHVPEVEKVTKSVYLDFLVTLDELKDFSETFGRSQLFAGIEGGSEKMAKLLKRFGFVFLGSDENNIDVYVYNKEED